MAVNHKGYNARFQQNIQNGQDPLADLDKKYGVRVVKAEVAEGETYWQVIGVHHLLPEENGSNHSIYLEALDENGNRVKNPPALAGWTWQGRQAHQAARPIAVEKPDNEMGADIALFFGQIASVWIQGVGPEGRDKSDRVDNLHTAHPDEPLPDGRLLNTLGHHSFYVVFQRTRKKAAAPTTGTISGRVERGQGRTLRLLRNNGVVAQQIVGNDSTYRFENVALGVYRLEVANTNVRQDNIRLNQSNRNETVNLVLPLPSQSVIAGQVRNGQGQTLQLQQQGRTLSQVVLNQFGNFRFSNLRVGVYSLVVAGTNIRRDNINVNGSNSQTVNLTVPIVDPGPGPVDNEKAIDHYILFGPTNTRGRQTNLLLATDYILHFSLTVGYSIEEAKRARKVTIIGEGIGLTDQQAIRAAKSQVEVIAGDAYNIEAQLTARVRSGRAFG